MSKFFLDRMRTELFLLFVEARKEKAQMELDKEVERITGKDCDDAAKTLSRDDFKRVAEEAMRNIRARRQKKKKKTAGVADKGTAAEVVAYA